MYVYCNNNPVNYLDSYGRMSEPAAGFIADAISKIVLSDENETNPDGSLTANAVLKRFGKSVIKNANFSLGIGVGFGVSATISAYGNLEFSADAKVKYDLLSILYKNGKLNSGQEEYGGFGVSAVYSEFGGHMSGRTVFGEEYSYPTWNWSLGEIDDIEFVGVSAYFGFGVSFSIGYDIESFILDLEGMLK